MTSHKSDVAIVGGAAAGLSAALVLARARRRVVVLDAGSPRNAPAAHMHNFLSRDGMPPAELLAAGRAEVLGYGAEIVSATAVGVENTSTGFDVALDRGNSVVARRLLIATGLTDQLPEVPGLRERWGRDVLHCPYCHGYEVGDQPVGVLGSGPRSVHQALLVRQLSPDVVLTSAACQGQHLRAAVGRRQPWHRTRGRHAPRNHRLHQPEERPDPHASGGRNRGGAAPAGA
jgi:thioredoxin reductase